jgi:cytochrome c oxidase subunit 1
MPRRYSDYPDAFITWNVISSVGSIVSFVATLGFVFIVWESFTVVRPSLFPTHLTTSIEWQHSFPPAGHSYVELVFLTSPKSN